MKKFLLLLSIITFISCDNSTKPKDKEFSVEIALTGAVQKGPFLNGTSILITELESDLTPTGRNFTSQIENNAGIFQLPTIEYSSQYVELKADGYYYNEINGIASSSPITLYALSDISNRTSVNVNLFTTLERPRVKQLIGEDFEFADAKDSIYKDILRAFSFPIDTIVNPEDLNLSDDGEENAKLLAISLILQGNHSEAELSELISNISFDLQTDGKINSSSITTDLFQGVNSLDTTKVRENLTARYYEVGVTANISDFEKYIKIFLQQQNDIVITFDRTISCSGDNLSSISISVSGGESPYTYQWSNGVITEDLENIGPGTYSVTINDSYGLSKTSDDIIIPDKIELIADVIHIDDEHSEGAIDLTVTGGEAPYLFEWSNGSTNEDISNLQLGEYSVTVTDANNCQEAKTVEIIDLDIVITVNKSVSCDGEASSSIDITVSGGKLPYTYQWSNGVITEDLENIGPGTYSVTINDSYGLSKTSDDIIIPDKIELIADVIHIDDEHSEGAIDLTVTGGEAPYLFEWSNGSTNEDISGLGLGEYTVTVTDANNCQETKTVEEIIDLNNIVDIDGNVYSAIKIGRQIWLKENIKVMHYRNGDPIPNVTDNAEWNSLSTGAYCYYENSDNNGIKYGALYNFYAVNDIRGITPEGWHVPSFEEWQTLVNYLGGSSVAGGKMKETGTEYWAIPNTGATNESGFTALPGGYRESAFSHLGDNAYFWSSTEIDIYYAWILELLYNESSIYYNNGWKGGNGGDGFSVRLVRD